MLREVDLVEAAKAATEGKQVYAVNLYTEEKRLVDFSFLIRQVRLLIDEEKSIDPPVEEAEVTAPKRKYTRRNEKEKNDGKTEEP